MTDSAIRPFPGHTRKLFFPWPGSAPLQEGAIRNLVLDALDAFWPAVLDPLAVELELECVDAAGFQCDPPRYPEAVAWLLRTAAVPEMQMNLLSFGHFVREVPSISRSALATWLDEALRQPPAEGTDHVAWAWVSFAAARVRVFEPERFAGRDTLEFDSEIGLVRVPLERDATGTWIRSPVEPLDAQPAVTVRCERLNLGLLLSVDIQWSPWMDEGTPGSASIDAVLAHLQTRGWEPH